MISNITYAQFLNIERLVNMISVICSRCGGSGQLEFLDYKKDWCWRAETCPKCRGTGRVQELSFNERKELKQKEATK